MADIELVVKIPKEEYEMIVNSEDCGLHILTRAIAHGVVLPKDHGRLIDADALIFNADYYEPLISKRDVDFAPTIIEADKN